jgi:glucose-1-phosphate thymidylyltransferase
VTSRRPLQAILLAAGYGTRLGELGRRVPKPLLELGDRPLADHLLEDLARIPEVTELLVVTNSRFRTAMEDWAGSPEERAPFPVRILDDGTSHPGERLGAVGDLAFALEQVGREEAEDPDRLVLAGDTLPGFPLEGLVTASARRPGADALLVLEEEEDPERLGERGVVQVDATGRITSFQEKPESPKSTLTALPIYLFRPDALARIQEFLREGGDPDAPGTLVAWLVDRVRVEGWRSPGARVDVGTPEGLEAARRRFGDHGEG